MFRSIAFALTPKYYSSYWLAQPIVGGGVRKEPHTDLEVQSGYMHTLDKLVLDEEECALVHGELSKYLIQYGVFANQHATKDRDRLNPIKWWNMYGAFATHLHKLVARVLSQVVNTYAIEGCWSTYSFIHSVKRNNLNVEWAKNLVYVHYNLRLLTHCCEEARNDRTYVNWDNNPKEDISEDGECVGRGYYLLQQKMRLKKIGC